MSADERVKAQLTPEGKFALLLIFGMLPTFAVFLVLRKPELGLATCESIGILLIALRAMWRLHNHGWYWGAVVVSLALQVPVILFVPWANHAYRGTALIAFGFVDFLVVWGCIKLAEKVMMKRI